MNKRRIGVATSGRADFGLLTPLLEALHGDPDISLCIYATGMHFSPRHGNTIEEVRSKSFAHNLIEIPCFPADDSPQAIGQSMASELAGFSRVFAGQAPDILVVQGDRYDIFPVAVAAINFNIPIAHISGGGVTEGAIDDSIRHALTKMSHLHFTEHEDYARRVIQLGEEPWRVTISGGPGLVGIRDIAYPPKPEFFKELGLAQDRPLTVLTYHPETIDPAGSDGAIAAILAAADEIDSQIVFTSPNADAGSRPIFRAIKEYCAKREDCRFHTSLGRTRYYAMLHYADCMVGNSSSGVFEAATFILPVVNIGDRQKGRILAANIIPAAVDAKEIAAAWLKALSREFRQSLAGLENPFGYGRAVELVMDTLKNTPLDKKLIAKRFHDLPQGNNPP